MYIIDIKNDLERSKVSGALHQMASETSGTAVAMWFVVIYGWCNSGAPDVHQMIQIPAGSQPLKTRPEKYNLLISWSFSPNLHSSLNNHHAFQLSSHHSLYVILCSPCFTSGKSHCCQAVSRFLSQLINEK